MVFMPILTSILAFVASWLTFQNSAMKGLKKDVSQLWVKMNRAEHKFRVAQLKNVEERVSLWGSLADPDEEPMPREFEVFRQQCFRKIRLKLHTNCCETFGPQLERYTFEVEARLAEMILIASQHSTLPQTISRIPLSTMTKAFDDQVSEDAEAWSCSRCGGVMVQDLERELDNMVVVAQFENATKANNWKRRKK